MQVSKTLIGTFYVLANDESNFKGTTFKHPCRYAHDVVLFVPLMYGAHMLGSL